MTTPGKNKNGSKILGTKKRKAAATSAIAVLAIAILLVSSIPMPTQGIPTTDKVPEQGYKGDYYVVRYHLNYPYYASIIRNAMDDGHNDGYSFSGQKSEQITVDNVTYTDYYVDVPSYGSIVSTEYNPQFWKDTVVTNQEISWNWLDVNRYVEDETVVFTGWRYFSADSGDTHYPGEVMSNADLKKAIKVNKTISGVTYSVKVLEVFATWDTVKEVRLVTRDGVATPDSDGRQAYTFDAAARSFPSAAEGGSPYTSIMLIYAQKNGNTGTTAEKERGKVVLGGTTSTYAPMTIRSDPVSKDANDFIGRLVASSNSGKFLAGADTIIDDLAIWFGGAGGNHGSTETGLYGMGHAFVIGTGIYSLFESGSYGADMRRGFTQISGGVNNYSKITTEHDIGVYVEDGVDEDGEPVPHVRSTPIRTMLIVHSGTWHNIMASGRGNTNGESVYAVVKNAVVLDTMAGAGSNGNNKQTFDSIYLYLVNTKLPGDMYEMQNLNLDNSIPRLIGRDTSFLPEWPYLIDSDHLAENTSLGIRSFGNTNHTESTILSGGSNGKEENIQNTFIYIAGESQLWDAQSAGRTPEKTTVINGTIELSGKATVAHILCGATTDGNQSNTAFESIKNTHIVVKDSAKAGTVCGAGFDTSYPAVSATMKNGGSIVVEIRGGTVCDVFGGGFRAITGTAAEPIDDISITVSGGKVLGDVYGGGSGGFNKKRHNSDGTWGAGFANADGDNDTTGRSRVYVNEVNIVITGDAVIEGSVYGGGKSVPAIRTYSGATRDNLNSAIARGDVAALICDQISVTVNDRAEVKGDVFGGGRGVPDITPAGTIAGENARNYTDMISISKDGEREYLPWYTSNNSSSGVAVFLYDSPANPEDGYLYGYAKVSGPYVNGSPTKADISVAVTDNAKVGSCVLGAGGRSLTYADTSVVVDGNAQVGGSVYGAGLMRMLTGDTDVYIGGGADIAYSVYGGGDVGVRDSDVDTALILVTGNSHVAVDGSEGANIGKSIMGDGNSGLVCDVDGNPSTRIVEITDYSPEHVMESLQNASSMSLVRSSVALSGRASSASAAPSDLMSLYNIDDLMLIGGSDLNLRSGMHNIRGYGSYVDMTMTPTTLSHPLNSVKVGAGVMFNTAYDDVNDIGNPYTKYGIISGYTILGHDISDDYYGAFAYGNLGSEGRFVQYKEGLLELIPFVDKSGGDDHDPFKLWTMIGSIKQTVSLVAVGNGTTEPQNTSTMFEIIPVSNDGKMEFMGSSIVMSSSEAHLVENVSDIDGYDDFRMTFGYGDPTKFLTFNDGAGATIIPDASEILMGSEASSFCKVNISLDYWGTQKLTGLIGQVYLEIQEVLTMEVDGAPVQVPVCTNIVCVNLYCSESMSSFAREDRVVEHSMTILIDKSGNGSGSFVIPYGYRNGILVMTEADDAGVTVDMRTAVNSYGSQGWIGAVGKGGLIEDCVGGEGYKLSGSFSATLTFTITGAEDLSARPYMEFTITDTTVKKFSLTINLAEVPDYTVKFYSQKYDYDALRSVVKGGDVSVPEPPYALAKTTHVEHGHQILKSQYPITYDNFVGWYRDPDCTRHFDTTMEVTENMELYAKYAFSTTFEIPSGNEVVPVPVVTKDVAHMEALYEDPDAPATATFGPDATAIEGHIGEMIELPEPASTAGFKGWAMDGRIYAAGDEIPLFKDSMAFTAVYEDSGTAAQVRFYEYVNNGRNTALLRTIDTHVGAEVELPEYNGTSSGFVGWTCQNAFYELGAEVVVASDVMDFIALIADGHNASILYGYDIVAHVGATVSLPVPPDNDFRGWLIDGKLYEADADGCLYTVTSLEDIDAIPVYRNDIIDVDVIYVDGSDETSEERKFGETFALPENQKEGFLGWYYDGLNYGSGTLFTVYSDEPARLVALYEGECTIYTFQENEPGSVGWVWNGRFYEGGRMLIVPSGVEVNPTALYEDDSAVVSVDAGRSAVLEKLKVGQSVTLPSPSEGSGFKGWVADGHLYMPGDQYRIMNDYSPLYKLVLSDDALAIANPGYTTNGEWYDLDDMKRFDNVNMSEHVIGNTTYRLKWEGLPVQIEFVALDGDQPIDMSAYDGVTIVYGSTFGNYLTEAAEHVKSVAQLKDVRWEILKPQDGEPARSGLYVYEGDVFSLPSFDAYTETSGDVRTLKLFADASDAAITVELTPGQQYVPHSASAVEFEAVYIKASDEDDPSTWATALFEEGGTQIADPVRSYVGSVVQLPKVAGVTGWVLDGVLYKDGYMFTSADTVTFAPLRSSDASSSVIFSIDLEKGRLAEFPTDDQLQVEGKVGDTISVLRVVDDGDWKFIGWSLDGHLVNEFTFMSEEPKTLEAEFCRFDSTDVSQLRFDVGANGVLVDSEAEIDARIGFITDLPDVAPMPGYRFAGWKIVSEGNSDYTGMAEDSGNVYPPRTFLVYPGDNPESKITEHLGTTVTLPLMPDDVPEGRTFVGWNYNGKTYAGGEELVLRDSGNILMSPVYQGSEATVSFFHRDGTVTVVNTSVGSTVTPYPSITGETLSSPYMWFSPTTNEVYYGANGTNSAGKTPIHVNDTEVVVVTVYCRNNVTMNFYDADGSSILTSHQMKSTRGYTYTIPDYTGTVPEGKAFAGWDVRSRGEFYEPGDTFYGHRYSGSTYLYFDPRFVDTSDTQTLTFSPGGTYTFHFGDALRQGYDLVGWGYDQYNTEAGKVEHVVLPMGKVAKIDHMDGDYILYYTDTRYIVVPDTVRFTAEWDNIEYVLEIQSPYEGRISWEWTVSADGESHAGGSISAGAPTKSINVRYGDQLEFTYYHKDGSKYSFSKWNRLGEGKFHNEESVISQLDVIGNASVFVTMSTTYDRILEVYDPISGTLTVTPYKAAYEEDGYTEYRVVSSETVTFTYESDTESLYVLYVNGEPVTGNTITVNSDTVVVPYLKLRSVDLLLTEEVRKVFAENESGTYVMDAKDFSGDLEDFVGGTVSLSYAENVGVAISPYWEGNVLRLMVDAQGVRGIIPVTVTVYGSEALSAVIVAEAYVIPSVTSYQENPGLR